MKLRSCPHQLVRPRWIIPVQELRHFRAKHLEVDRLRDVAIETCGDTLFYDFSHDVGGKCDYRHEREFVAFFPLANVTAGLIAILSRHMEVALSNNVRLNPNKRKYDLPESMSSGHAVLQTTFPYTRLHHKQSPH
jgi:hypothetical protein